MTITAPVNFRVPEYDEYTSSVTIYDQFGSDWLIYFGGPIDLPQYDEIPRELMAAAAVAYQVGRGEK